jgi:hypothetical protein
VQRRASKQPLDRLQWAAIVVASLTVLAKTFGFGVGVLEGVVVALILIAVAVVTVWRARRRSA